MTLLIFLIICILLIALYILCVRGRRGHPGLAELRRWRYAHRGLHNADRPENSMAAFRAALDGGYGFELDIHLLKDGNLAVIHDSLLKRTTGAEGRIEDLTTEELSSYYLEGTLETIPTFQQVLDLNGGKVPMIVELKAVDGNHAILAETACRMLEDYDGAYCIESFDPRCVLWLKRNRPQLIRGQLVENFVTRNKKLPWILCFLMTHQLGNFLLMPDFIAYRFDDQKTVSNPLVRKLWGVQGVTWTVQSPQELEIAEQDGWIPIFENFLP